MPSRLPAESKVLSLSIQTSTMSAGDTLPTGLTVFERGWMSSNNVLLRSQGTAVLVDSGHVLHGEQTVALLRRALADAPLAGIVNTHLHSDHCGGNARVQRELGGRITVPPGSWDAARAWDEDALSYRPTGQRCERFVPHAMLKPGETLDVGSQRWQAFAAPGHDPHSLVLFEPALGVLISADALWQNGFGVVFPELEGEQAFDDVAAVLDLIESLDARWVVPGHGAPFMDVDAALRTARERLAGFRARPERHARHGAKVLVKYHVMEERSQPLPALLDWCAGTSLFGAVWQRLGQPLGSARAYAEEIVRDLCRGGALALRDGVVHDA